MSSPIGNKTPHGVIYREKLWVPWYWWLLGALVVALLTGQMAHNRNEYFLWIPLALFSAAAVTVLLKWSSTVIEVVEDNEGVRWLHAGGAELPADAVARCMAVPESAKFTAMGRQLDPAAFVVSHGWITQMAMFVLVDDDGDPVPYWLISTSHPEKLISSFVPHLARNSTTQ